MKKAVAYTFIFNNQIFVTEEEKEKENKTLSGLLSICLFLIRLWHACHVLWHGFIRQEPFSLVLLLIFHLLILMYILANRNAHERQGFQ